MKKVVAIVGPTASGKSSLGIALAKALKGEVVSADSRQVYKGLDLGTGKVTKKEMRGVPHHLLDVASPKRRFTAAQFVSAGRRAIKRIDRPIIVGGTGLYADMLVGRVSFADAPPDLKLRAKLQTRSLKQLMAQLRRLDPRRAAAIEPHHKRRIIRAIEIAKALGKSPEQTSAPVYDALWLGLSPDDEALKRKIRARLKARLKAGMVAEATRLHAEGLSYRRMEELGLEYRYLSLLLQKKLTRAEFEQELERAIWQYVRRQRKWFRRNPGIVWVKGEKEALRLAKAFLSR